MTFRPVTIYILYLGLLLIPGVPKTVLADDLIIDDRSSGNMASNIGTEWLFVADTVMGGVSTGNVTVDSHNGKNCLRMRGNVSTENNGGFVQMALSLSGRGVFDAS